jgi:hypothetical protein
MHHERLLAAVDDVALALGDVVADVPEQRRAELLVGDAERPGERALGQAHHRLPVGPREVGGGGHGAEIAAPFGRIDGRAGELAIGHDDAVARHRGVHRRQVVVAHLIAEPA